MNDFSDPNWKPDATEKGRDASGQPVSMDRRLYMQLLAYGDCRVTPAVIKTLASRGITAAVYEDLNDPLGIAIVVASDSADFFVDELRDRLRVGPFDRLTLKSEYAMFGRTYALGYETDLEHALIERPTKRLLDPALPWVIWYPLRRSGSFEQLSAKEQRDAMIEHGRIGSAFGEAGLGNDIRLACHGLDKNDNDFVIGLLGKELHPLSILVQTMRKTIQTSQHIEKLGPFFVGKKVWQSEE